MKVDNYKNLKEAILILIVFILCICTGCQVNENEVIAENGEEFTGARYVRTSVVTIGNIERVLNYSGFVVFDQAINILPNMAGRIDRINVREGQQVTTGQVLAVIDQNSLMQAEANFNLAENNFQRAQNLFQQNAIDQRSFEETELFYINARTAFELAKENLEVKAPFSGTISQSNFRINDNYSPLLGMPLFRIINNEDVYIEVNVTNTDVRQLRLNQRARVIVDGRNIEAFIAFISPENDRLTGLNRVRIEFRTPQRELRNNQFASVELIPEAKENVLMIPRTALLSANTVILAVDGRAFFRNIVTGLESRHFVEVTEGLQEGDRVIIEGGSGLVNESHIVEFSQ
ncbi:MAG: efflux RND transporter periplasmic adaptor subunit [Candidatus Cloacimonetes bacterium]|nr:efflux RND transporter periplasmic adaptor subunit [Candidatus Cloacimonadota bacterium]